MKLLQTYFNWLQKDTPFGKPDRYPALTNGFETSVPGVYCIGDLTGVPLLQSAAETGDQCIEDLLADPTFSNNPDKKNSHLYDLIIAGAGPAGVSASLRATKAGLNHLVVEANQCFSTIRNYPNGKPIFTSAQTTPSPSALTFTDGTKETLLVELNDHLEKNNLPIQENESVTGIVKEGAYFTVQTSNRKYKAQRVIIAIGKTGNPRTLNVPGKQLPKVFNRLLDPGAFDNADILVVGGGDSAIEAAIALAEKGNRVTHSYRKKELSRPKEYNLTRFKKLIEKGSIVSLMESTVTEIRDECVLLGSKSNPVEVPNQYVFTLIGSEIPVSFFRRSGIIISGDKSSKDRLQAIVLVLFASLLYFGKKAPATPVSSVIDFFSVPLRLVSKTWSQTFTGWCGWGSFLLLVMASGLLGSTILKTANKKRLTPWQLVKYLYFLSVALLVMWLYTTYKLLDLHPVFSDMGTWYTLLYSLTIVIFGIRRILVHPTGYIKRQTLTLMGIQLVPLCILPLFVLPYLGNNGYLSNWIMENVFMGQSYWRAYGFILAWPLFIHNLATGQPTLFWFLIGMLQTFILIPLIIYRWGKGAYCGWICSCGALAETLGDEYRIHAPHGRPAKRWENIGQIVLVFSFVVTLLALLSGSSSTSLSRFASSLYAVTVDIFLAGVLGVGVYTFLSGRIWCRYFCPLAALMHIYTRFSVYRIFADKKRCISCSICTAVCHMGIDVMSYANKGIPMNDVECVRCSACIVSCPMDVLYFGRVQSPPARTRGMGASTQPERPDNWTSGLPG